MVANKSSEVDVELRPDDLEPRLPLVAYADNLEVAFKATTVAHYDYHHVVPYYKLSKERVTGKLPRDVIFSNISNVQKKLIEVINSLQASPFTPLSAPLDPNPGNSQRNVFSAILYTFIPGARSQSIKIGCSGNFDTTNEAEIVK